MTNYTARGVKTILGAFKSHIKANVKGDGFGSVSMRILHTMTIKERDIFIQPESDNNRTWQPTEIEERPSRKRTVNQSPVTMAIRELMGDSDTLDVSSKELATRANMTPREVGSWLAQYRGELEKEQGLTFTRSRGSSGTVYTFSAL